MPPEFAMAFSAGESEGHACIMATVVIPCVWQWSNLLKPCTTTAINIIMRNEAVGLWVENVVVSSWKMMPARRSACRRLLQRGFSIDSATFNISAQEHTCNLSIPLCMPEFGSSENSTGRVTEWYKTEGDFVEAEEPVCELETPQMIVDVVAANRGYLAKIGLLGHCSLRMRFLDI